MAIFKKKFILPVFYAFLLKFKLFLKRFIRKPERTFKTLWIAPNYIYILSFKSKGSRMGKGKGKKHIRMFSCQAGSPLIESSHIRVGKLLLLLYSLYQRLGMRLWLQINVVDWRLISLHKSVRLLTKPLTFL